METMERERYVTKPVREKVDNLTQIYIWNNIVKREKLKADEMLIIKLITCEACQKQRISVVTDNGELSEYDDCIVVPTMCNEDIIVCYDKEENTEYMMLVSEISAETLKIIRKSE